MGGLSIVRELRARMPAADLLYVSDARFLPYGDKSELFIRERAFALSRFLVEHGARALVLACNTATAAAVHELRQSYELPIIGVEPALKPALATTRSGTVGILATSSTLQSRKYGELVQRLGGFARVIDQPCAGLVECVERGELDSARTLELLRGYVAPLLEAGADTLVLGCTHYPFLLDSIRALAGEAVRIIDPGEAVARRVVEVLQGDADGQGELRCFSSGDCAAQSALALRLIGQRVEVEPLAAPFCQIPGG